jgi:hypothetical protein
MGHWRGFGLGVFYSLLKKISKKKLVVATLVGLFPAIAYLNHLEAQPGYSLGTEPNLYDILAKAFQTDVGCFMLL